MTLICQRPSGVESQYWMEICMLFPSRMFSLLVFIQLLIVCDLEEQAKHVEQFLQLFL